MTAVGLPFQLMHNAQPGRFLTFIAPAPNGCNLNCGFCLIRQRGETGQSDLQPDDLARFIHEANAAAPLHAVAMQGYEPLLPESLPYTQAVLATARLLGVPSSIVTNGVHLGDTLDLLGVLKPWKIGVSLDATDPEAHDRVRRVNGAWAATVASVKAAVATLSPQDSTVAVASVLTPTRRQWLDGMPELLNSLGVSRWIINPLINIGASKAGGPAGTRQGIFEDLLILQDAAAKAGIVLTVDDELDGLHHKAARAAFPDLARLHVRTLPRHVQLVRLSPDGSCSVGSQILQKVANNSLCWDRVENAARFLQRTEDEFEERAGERVQSIAS